MSPSEAVLVDLVASVYEASADASRWEGFLEKLVGVTQAGAAALLTHHLNREHHRVDVNWNLDPAGVARYHDFYGSVDVWTQGARSKPAGTVVGSDSLCPYRELRKTEFYNDFLAEQNIGRGLFAFVERNTQCLSVLSVYRGPDSAEFDVSEMKILQLLVPHLRRAVNLHYRFSELKTHADGMEAALNALAVGVIFVSNDATILFMNNNAKQILDNSDGLLYARNKLTAKVASEASRLHAMIAETVRTSMAGCEPGSTVLISREHKRPFSLSVAPFRLASSPFGSEPAAVLFITNPDDNEQLPADLARDCYGLTDSETKLTLLLLQGRSLKEAAFSSGITYNTAKSQLKSVFQKTRVRRQSALIRLLLNSCPATAITRASS